MQENAKRRRRREAEDVANSVEQPRREHRFKFFYALRGARGTG
jgi:hypothetical protein